MKYLPWFSNLGEGRGKGKGKGKGKTGACWMNDNMTTAGQIAEHGRIRKAARQAKMKAQDGIQASAIGTTGETARAKEYASTGMASHKNGSHRGKARPARRAAARAVSAVLTKPATATG